MSPVFIYWSWAAYLVSSSLLLFLCIFWNYTEEPFCRFSNSSLSGSSNFLIVAAFALAAIVLSLSVTRSDLDDSFYVALAAFTSSHPQLPLIASDPMFGELGFPLLFESYRFSSFEMLSAAIAYTFSIPAMDVYYIYLLPVWAVAAVVAIFLLTKELIPDHWLMAGVVTLLLILLLGETHRSPANFSFVRIFQGKAVFLSVVVPTIFYVTARFFSERGATNHLFLLACCQLSSVGMTNFGMVLGPLAGFGAILSNLPLFFNGDRRKLLYSFAVLLIPLPYLVYVFFQSQNSPLMELAIETPYQVFVSVFGEHQQYLVGTLLVTGPLFAKNTLTRWRLAVPPLLLFAIYLNPWLSELISRYITSPPVYWRVVWSFPVIVFCAVSFCTIVINLFLMKEFVLFSSFIFFLILILGFFSLPYNTLRPSNIGTFRSLGGWKIPSGDLVVALKAIEFDKCSGRLLAPDEIAGVISRFENHPRLVSTRGQYLSLIRPYIGDVEFSRRYILYRFVTGETKQSPEKVIEALRYLDVSVVVSSFKTKSQYFSSLLKKEGYFFQELINGYSIWTRADSTGSMKDVHSLNCGDI